MQNKKRNWLITILITFMFAAIGYLVSGIAFPLSSVSNLPVPTNTLDVATLVPRIDKILEINFSSGDNFTCITEDPKLGGYDHTQYTYFLIGTKNGYITYCNVINQINQGSFSNSQYDLLR